MVNTSKYKIIWEDKPENYSKEIKSRLIGEFASKYDINKKNVDLDFKPIRVNSKGEKVDINGGDIDNILDVTYQQSLMKTWLDRNNKSEAYDRLLKLDKKVNGLVTSDFNNKNNRKWKLKELWVNNLLAFGDGNYINFDKLNGLNIINSIPANTGGKTTFSIDTIKFLLYGNVTKADKNEEIFNLYSGKDTVMVKGRIEIEGENEYIIERVLSRRVSKTKGWNVTSKLNYYTILPDGEEVLLNEEDSIQTTKKIKEFIGEEKMFDITVMATANNLNSLLNAKPTESGKLINKFIGLEILEEKEQICKKMLSDFNSKRKGQIYKVDELTNTNETLESEITTSKYDIKTLSENKIDYEKNKTMLLELKDTLLSSKAPINSDLIKMDVNELKDKIKTTTIKGTSHAKKISDNEDKIKVLKKYEYDEVKYKDLISKVNELKINKGNIEYEIKDLTKSIKMLKDGEICHSCNRPLDNIDNTTEVNNLTTDKEILDKKLKDIISDISNLSKEISVIDNHKVKVEDRQRLEVSNIQEELLIEKLRNNLKDLKSSLNSYKDNEESINKNIDLDAKIEIKKAEINVMERNINDITNKINRLNITITSNEKTIKINEELISTILKEDEVVKLYKLYLDMYGKKGINRLVLRSILPIINSELSRLMEDVCDFKLELDINQKNEIEYTMEQDGIIKPCKGSSGFEGTVSSIALRCVLGRLSHLPIPNFITFDEVFGTVAYSNLPKLKPMFEKISTLFDMIFLITHIELVKDWADNFVTIVKEDNISYINIT